MNKLSILMIDDDPVFIQSYAAFLNDEYQVIGAADIPAGIKCIEKQCPAVLLLDISFKAEREGLAALPHIKKEFPHLPIVIVTNWDSHLICKEALTLGADDFFVKSDNVSQLKVILQNLLVRGQKPALGGQRGVEEPDEFPVAQSAVFKHVLNEARKVSRCYSTSVLVTGETGVGKEVVAEYIHKQSQRRSGPFIAVNCGSLPATLIESELFGHEKGAFTGALHQKKGRFEMADGGTIFLDEIEDMPLQSQPALLRVLEGKAFERLGGTQSLTVNVRIIAATQSDLKERVEKGAFREDLRYRLSVYPIHIPPLRQREDDVLPLCHYFLKDFQEKNRTGKKRLSQSTLLMLKNYNWPGNVRELRNVIERAVVRSEGVEIRPADFLLQDVSDTPIALPYDSAKSRAVREFQKNYIKSALCRNKGNISVAAKEIGISRQALTKIVQELHLDVNRKT